MAIRPVSPGASMFARLHELMQQRETAKRQQMLDGLTVQNQLMQHARMENEMRRQAARDQQDAEDRQRRIASEDQARQREQSIGANAAGMRQMTADVMLTPDFATNRDAQRQMAAALYREGQQVPGFLTDSLQPAPEPKRQVLETVDSQGRPVRRSVTDDELAAGVPVYQQPREPREPNYLWIVRNGQPMRVSEGQIRPGDAPYSNPGSSGDRPTQSQLTANTFVERAADASRMLDELEGEVSNWGSYWPNFMQSDAGQSYEQAASQFIEAYLRKDSGAAIGKDEYANARRTYFPMPGDSAATRERKQAARHRIIASMQQQGTGGNAGVGDEPRNGGSPTPRRVYYDMNGNPIRR